MFASTFNTNQTIKTYLFCLISSFIFFLLFSILKLYPEAQKPERRKNAASTKTVWRRCARVQEKHALKWRSNKVPVNPSPAKMSMVNEQMLAFYLAKVFQLPKEKFRFLATQEIVEEAERLKAEAAWEKRKTVHKPEAPVALIKMVVEIVED